MHVFMCVCRHVCVSVVCQRVFWPAVWAERYVAKGRFRWSNLSFELKDMGATPEYLQSRQRMHSADVGLQGWEVR